MRVRLIIIPLVFALAVSACSSKSGGGASGETVPKSDTATVAKPTPTPTPTPTVAKVETEAEKAAKAQAALIEELKEKVEKSEFAELAAASTFRIYFETVLPEMKTGFYFGSPYKTQAARSYDSGQFSGKLPDGRAFSSEDDVKEFLLEAVLDATKIKAGGVQKLGYDASGSVNYYQVVLSDGCQYIIDFNIPVVANPIDVRCAVTVGSGALSYQGAKITRVKYYANAPSFFSTLVKFFSK